MTHAVIPFLLTILLLACGGSSRPAAPPPADASAPPSATPAPRSPAPIAEASPYGLLGTDYACAPCGPAAPFVAKVVAPSVLEQKDDRCA